MKNLTDLDIKNQTVLIRVDFNVPLAGDFVLNDFRIRAAMPTINYCLQQNAAVVLMSHLGRPGGEVNLDLSLEPVAKVVQKFTGRDVHFSDDCISEDAVKTSLGLYPGEIHLLENLRFYKGETKNNAGFSKNLAGHSKIFINDAFGTAHRAHASNCGIVAHVKQAASGFLLQKERKYLSDSIKAPNKPLVVVLGGSKVSGKIELIINLMNSAQSILVGGAMAFTFLKVLGKNIGCSIVDQENLPVAEKILKLSDKMGVPIILPNDVVAATELTAEAPWRVTFLDDLQKDEMGLDIGPESSAKFESAIIDARTILWNGPLGVFEIPNFSTGTHSIASAIRDHTIDEDAVSIIGGGDTAAAIEYFNLREGFTHISTGGGASLELLSGIYLPAFKELDDNE